MFSILSAKMIQKRMYAQILRSFNRISSSKRVFSNETNRTADKETVNKKRFLRQSQGLHAFRPQSGVENPTIILFPGQGSQFVGMAKSLAEIPEAKDMFDLASDILRFVSKHYKL